MNKFVFERKTYYNTYVISNINIKMETISATKARSNFFQLLKQAAIDHLPFRIISKAGPLILLAEEDYDSLVETAELLSISGLKESIDKSDLEIKSGDIVAMDNIFSTNE